MMSRTQQAASVAALCLTILMAGLFIAYKPGMPVDDTTKTGPLIPGTGISTTGYKSITEGTTPTKTMSVSGTGTISVKANQAIIVLGVYTEGKLASTAIDENSALMNEVVKALKAAGITEDNMQTMGYNVVPVYNWEVRMNVGYQVTNSLQIKVNDLTKVGAVIDAASAAGANKVDSVTFTLSESTSNTLKTQAYEKAIADVKAKAKVLSDGFGIKITGVQSVGESYYSPPIYRNSYISAEAGKSSTPIIAGNLDVTVTLSVVYTIDSIV
jgi:uncharacterized protein